MSGSCLFAAAQKKLFWFGIVISAALCREVGNERQRYAFHLYTV